MFHVNIVHTNMSHVDIIMLRVEINHLGYKGQKYGGILMPATSKIIYVNYIFKTIAKYFGKTFSNCASNLRPPWTFLDMLWLKAEDYS